MRKAIETIGEALASTYFKAKGWSLKPTKSEDVVAYGPSWYGPKETGLVLVTLYPSSGCVGYFGRGVDGRLVLLAEGHVAAHDAGFRRAEENIEFDEDGRMIQPKTREEAGELQLTGDTCSR